MIFYITLLRALASILITNAHYTGVYPIELIANGGLLGDVLFFAISGFCLYNIKDKFSKWYSKRIFRIYPAVWIITLIYLMIGFYTLDEMNLFEYLIYPTYYHFVASIIFLYIIYYIIIKIDIFKNNIPKIMIGLLIIQILIYIFVYDKSYYHIDTVREPMVRFLFLQSMLLGAVFRQKNDKYLNNNKIFNWIKLIIFLAFYFISKLFFTKIPEVTEFQLINQIILFVTLYYFLKCFAGINSKLEKLPNKIKNVIKFLSSIILEIYIVQYPIIPIFKNLVFPINWLAITITILIVAYILHIVSKQVINFIERIVLNENTNNRSSKI